MARFVRWFCSGYDWPLHKDWLAWVGLALVCVVSGFRVQTDGAWDLLGAPLAFAVYGWLLGAIRNLWRGYREANLLSAKPTRRAAGRMPQ